MRVSVQACTRRSRSHGHNEDRATVGAEVLSDTTGVERWSLQPPATVAVLDGVGGAPSAALASDLAARAISAAEPPIDEAAASALLARADRLLLDAGQVDVLRKGMATTAAALVFHDGDGTGLVANVGDSQILRLASDGLEVLSVSDRIQRGIYQSLGGHDDPDMTPHVRTIDLEVGDRLLLATDGMTDVIPPAQVEQVLRDERQDAAAHLLRRVEQAHTPDDVTIVVIDLEDD